MFQSSSYILNSNELQENINHLRELYYPIDLNAYYYENKVKAMKNLRYILKFTNRRTIQESDFDEMVKCSLTLIYYFGMRLKLNMVKRRQWVQCVKKVFQKAEKVFQETMDTLQPEYSERIIHITLDFFTKTSLWPFENFVAQILEVILYYSRGKIMLFNIMLTDIHCTVFRDLISARHRMRVFYDLLKSDNWIIDKNNLMPFITRLLDFFTCSISKAEESPYRYLKRGFDVCLRRIFERAENSHRIKIIWIMLKWFSFVNLNDTDILEFSSLIEHAARFYHVKQYDECLHENILNEVLTNFVGSANSINSLVGCRLLVVLLDRQKNGPYLSIPEIYYEFSQVPLKIGEYDNNDKIFMRQHRELFHDFLYNVTRHHYCSLINMKTLYAVIACSIIEVPCGLTAVAASCLAMNIQDFAVTTDKLPEKSRCWLHAIVLSIMSLICWVHKAPDLYHYVNEIVTRRAKDAPHLNPPLLQTYKLDKNQVYWKKPMLFFEDWELRYGLWKHFQSRRQQEKLYEIQISKKKPKMNIES